MTELRQADRARPRAGSVNSILHTRRARVAAATYTALREVVHVAADPSRIDPYGDALSALTSRVAIAWSCPFAVVDATDPSGATSWSALDHGSADPRRSRWIPAEVRGRLHGHVLVAPEAERRRELLDDVVALAGWLLQQRWMSRDLDTLRRATLKAEVDLAEDRQQAAVDMDGVRKTLECDLHDGAQADLVAAKAHLALLRHRDGDADAAPAKAQVSSLLDAFRSVASRIQSIATGTTSREVLSEGLAAAVRAAIAVQGRSGSVALREDLGGRRYPFELESAALFVCLESLANARKHAPNAAVTVHLEQRASELVVTVADTGPGLKSAVAPGLLRTARRRVASVGGRLTVDSSCGSGTRVVALLPF